MQTNKLLVIIASVIEICLGLTHFVTLNSVVISGGYNALSPDALSMFKLAMLCVGLLLVFAGVISLATLKLYDDNRKYFVGICRIQFLLWAGRFYLETLFPIKVAMPMMNQPTQYVQVAAFALCVLFIVASFYKKRDLENNSEE